MVDEELSFYRIFISLSIHLPLFQYGDEVEWTEHFEYLLQFFRHEHYLTVDGRPVFFIYRIGHSNLPFILGRILMMMIMMMGDGYHG